MLPAVMCICLCASCGDDDSGPDENQTGASLQGRVVAFDASQMAVAPFALASFGTPGVQVEIGSKSTETDAAGNFGLQDIALGDQTVTFSLGDAAGTYIMRDIEPGEAFFLDEIQYSAGNIVTKHTGTWAGTADSNDPDSVDPIDVELVLEENGNRLTGTARAQPEISTWTLEGTETGFAVEGTLTLVNSESGCTADMEFGGTFVADTLSGTFIEVDPPSGCGPPESGTFRVEKQ
jgi:hypothetical protein